MLRIIAVRTDDAWQITATNDVTGRTREITSTRDSRIGRGFEQIASHLAAGR